MPLHLGVYPDHCSTGSPTQGPCPADPPSRWRPSQEVQLHIRLCCLLGFENWGKLQSPLAAPSVKWRCQEDPSPKGSVRLGRVRGTRAGTATARSRARTNKPTRRPRLHDSHTCRDQGHRRALTGSDDQGRREGGKTTQAGRAGGEVAAGTPRVRDTVTQKMRGSPEQGSGRFTRGCRSWCGLCSLSQQPRAATDVCGELKHHDVRVKEDGRPTNIERRR